MTIFNYGEYLTDRYAEDEIEVIEKKSDGYYSEMEYKFKPATTREFDLASGDSCLYCYSKNMVCIHKSNDLDHHDYGKTMSLHVCTKCGWWFAERTDKDKLGFSEYYTEWKYISVLRTFKADEYSLPLDVLNAEAKKNPDIFHHLHPKKFEELVKWVFESFYKCEVKHVGKSHDGGIDLIMLDADSPIAIQVKRRANPNAVEPVSIVREFLGAMVHKDYEAGIFVSTADHFSGQAQKLTQDILNSKKLFQFDLINFDRFIRVFDLVNTEKINPWQHLKLPALKKVEINLKDFW